MTQDLAREGVAPSVAPLRMKRPDGKLYDRPKEIEAALTVLLQSPANEIVRRARIEGADDPDYVPSECVLYLVRRPSTGIDEAALQELFTILRRRVLRAVPVPGRRLDGSTRVAEKATDLETREAVLDKFQELLCGDRGEYDERLDFYECRFNQALALLRSTARRDVRREVSRLRPLVADADSNELSAEVEAALASIRGPSDGRSGDFLFRSKLHVAISSLPSDERQVIELLLQGMPIDSKEGDVLTIAKVLRCTEKTVRNRRDRAFARLRNALREDDA